VTWQELLLTFLDLFNETLAAAIVVVAVSMLLYNVTRNYHDRVARTSAAVLTAVSIAYISDVFLSLRPGPVAYEAGLRIQWIGIALIPSTLLHLSDALLATTGLPSRGRRRRVIRLSYVVTIVFILLAAFTNYLVQPVPNVSPPSLRAAPLFPVYVAFFIIASGFALINVDRARRRCLTRSTKRRMAYLQVAILMPALGVFPFSMFLSPGEEFTFPALILVNAANILVILTLFLLSYPLSFFGSRVPDRVVKTELLRFMLRGPVTGLLILVVIIFTRPATQILGLPGDTFMPFAVVAVVLFWQWMVDLALPLLEQRLIYPNEDDEQISKIQTLSRHLLTRADLTQLLEGVLEAACDYLQVNTAFIASFAGADMDLIHKTGNGSLDVDRLRQNSGELLEIIHTQHDQSIPVSQTSTVWDCYWVLPLYSQRNGQLDGKPALIGVMGVETDALAVVLDEDERKMIDTLHHRAERTLDDLLLQGEIYAALEGLLPQLATSRARAAEVEFKPGYALLPADAALPERDQIIEQVQAALRHYYGGPGLTQSRLLELQVVRDALDEHDSNPARALRAVLDRAIENQRPEGERDLKSQEWLLYNILNLRFIKKRRARDTAKSLYISEANLYRKQNMAIEAVADTIVKMEEEVTKTES
jgi:hypothetical protein